MSSGMFRGKESLNRIEISRLVQDLLNFGIWAPCGSGEGAGGWGCLEASGGHGRCHHMHAHTHTHANACIEIGNGHRHGGIHVYHVYHVSHACACVHMHADVCVCVHGIPPYTPIPDPTPSTHLPPPMGDPWNWSKFNNT